MLSSVNGALKTVITDAQVAVIDDFLPEADFTALFKHFMSMDFFFIQRNKWKKSLRLSDGNALEGGVITSGSLTHGDSKSSSVHPTPSPFDPFFERLFESVEQMQQWIGMRGGDWDLALFTPYVNPRGTKLSWQMDYECAGSFVYYVNPHWERRWGGELLIAAATSTDQPPQADKNVEYLAEGRRVDSPEIDSLGRFVLPKPNRLVVLKNSAYYCIKDLEPAVGDTHRLTLMGQFKKQSSTVDPERA